MDKLRTSGLSAMITLLVAAVCLNAEAQTPVARLQDKRVRITSPSLYTKPVKGKVSAVAQDTLVVEVFQSGESNYLRIPSSEITRCEVQVGSQAHPILGAVVGGIVGIGTGTVALVAGNGFSHHNHAPVVIGLSTAGGAAIGAVVGLLKKTDLWGDVPLASIRSSVGPSDVGGIGVSLSFAFK